MIHHACGPTISDQRFCLHLHIMSVWNVCKLLGKSGLLQVYKGTKDGVHDVAIKIFKSVSTARDLELLQTEIAVLRSCNNRNIVHFYGVSFKGSDAWLVMELLEKGNLYNALAYGRGLCTWYNRYCLYSFLSVSVIHAFRPVMTCCCIVRHWHDQVKNAAPCTHQHQYTNNACDVDTTVCL